MQGGPSDLQGVGAGGEPRSCCPACRRGVLSPPLPGRRVPEAGAPRGRGAGAPGRAPCRKRADLTVVRSLEARHSSTARLHRSAPRDVAQVRSWRWGCSPAACPQLRGRGVTGWMGRWDNGAARGPRPPCCAPPPPAGTPSPQGPPLPALPPQPLRVGALLHQDLQPTHLGGSNPPGLSPHNGGRRTVTVPTCSRRRDRVCLVAAAMAGAVGTPQPPPAPARPLPTSPRPASPSPRRQRSDSPVVTVGSLDPAGKGSWQPEARGTHPARGNCCFIKQQLKRVQRPGEGAQLLPHALR